MIVRDAPAAEDILQNVVLKALNKEVSFEAEGTVLSWAFITACREGIDRLRRYRKESTNLESEILELLRQKWLSETARRSEARMETL